MTVKYWSVHFLGRHEAYYRSKCSQTIEIPTTKQTLSFLADELVNVEVSQKVRYSILCWDGATVNHIDLVVFRGGHAHAVHRRQSTPGSTLGRPVDRLFPLATWTSTFLFPAHPQANVSAFEHALWCTIIQGLPGYVGCLGLHNP